MTNSDLKPKKNKLSFIALLALTTGNIVGSGIYLLPTSLANIGSIALYGWIFSGIGALLLAVIFSQLSKKISNNGGPYIYVKQVLGDSMAFQTAYNYWIAILIGNAAIAISIASYLGVFWPDLLKSKISCAIALAAIWFCTALNLFSAKGLGRAQIIFNILKFAPLILIGLFGWWFVDKNFYLQSYNVSTKSNFDAISAAATITLWAFLGIESATLATNLTNKPRTNIPLATILAVAISAAIYISCSAVIMGIVEPKLLQQSSSPFADAAQIIFGNVGKYIIAAGIILSCLGTLHGWILLQGQFSVAIARDKLLPAIFAKKNRQEIPASGLFLTSLIASALIILTSYTNLAHQFLNLILLATLANILAYIYTVIAFAKLQLSSERQKYFYLFLALLVVSYLGWAFFTIDSQLLFCYALLLGVGTIFYKIQIRVRNL